MVRVEQSNGRVLDVSVIDDESKPEYIMGVQNMAEGVLDDAPDEIQDLTVNMAKMSLAQVGRRFGEEVEEAIEDYYDE